MSCGVNELGYVDNKGEKASVGGLCGGSVEEAGSCRRQRQADFSRVLRRLDILESNEFPAAGFGPEHTFSCLQGSRVELFKVTCVTCHARLAVRDSSVIGKILACPKCGSMVQVAAPEGFAAAPAAKTPAAPLDSVIGAAGPQAMAPATFEEAAAVADSLNQPSGAAEVVAPDSVASASVAPTEVVGFSVLKFAAISVAAAVVGAGLVTGALKLRGGGGAAAEGQESAVSDTTSQPAPASDSKDQAKKADPSSLPPTVVESSGQQEPSEPSETTVVEPPVSGEPESVEPLTTANQDEPPAEPAPPEEVRVAIATPAVRAEEPRPVEIAPARQLQIDPLQVDPEGLNLSVLMSDSPATDSETNDVAALESSPPEPAAPTLLGVTRHSPRVANPEAAVEVESLLARKFPAVTAEKVPLCRLLDFATQLSGLPVSVAPEQLRMAGVSAAILVDLKAADVTIVEMLSTSLAPLRLTPKVENKQIVLVRTGLEKKREISYPLDDVITPEFPADSWSEFIQEFVSPDSWPAAGGDGEIEVNGSSIRVVQPESVQYDILVLLESYRAARRMPLRSKYPAALVAGAASNPALADRLDAPTTFAFTTPTPLREVFRYWQEESGVAVLADWPAIAELRLSPQSRLSCSAGPKPWGSALDDVLHSLGLGWRAVGPRTIEITSQKKVDQEPMLEVFPLVGKATIDSTKLLDEIERITADETQQGKKAPAIASWCDARNRILVVRQPAAGQRRLARWLAQNGYLAEAVR